MDKLADEHGSRVTYLSRDLPCEEEMMSFKGLAKALELTADNPRGFYEGDITVKLQVTLNC